MSSGDVASDVDLKQAAMRAFGLHDGRRVGKV